MSDLTSLMEAHPEGEAGERFRFECAGGAMAVTAAQDRLTPYGGAAAWSREAWASTPVSICLNIDAVSSRCITGVIILGSEGICEKWPHMLPLITVKLPVY